MCMKKKHEMSESGTINENRIIQYTVLYYTVYK